MGTYDIVVGDRSEFKEYTKRGLTSGEAQRLIIAEDKLKEEPDNAELVAAVEEMRSKLRPITQQG